ncbi:MAG: hypothetical protein GXX92_12730 [Clostridiales bacterium]|nr:hypothetical protein [Clostridiales bacterium]
MSKIRCPICQFKQPEDGRTTCEICGASLFQEKPKKEKKERKEMTEAGKIALGFSLVVFLVLGYTWYQNEPSKTPTAPPENKPVYKTQTSNNQFVAYAMATEFVEQMLLAPTTADFPSFRSEAVQQVNYDTWIVNSYVDSQNAFGAMIRTHYRAKVMFLGDERWKLLDLQTK